MSFADPSSYGQRVATFNDAWVAPAVEASSQPAVEFLADIAAAGGTALELGIGTGRIALPLAASGVRVVGIDLVACAATLRVAE